MEAQKTQAIAEQSVLKAEESLQSNKPQISTLISNLLQRETFIKPSLDYFKNTQNNQVSEYMREELVVWMLELSNHLDLFPQTRQLAVNYLDLTLSRARLSLHSLQLLSISCLFLAQKVEGYKIPYETGCLPKILDHALMRRLTNNQYSMPDFVNMEILIFKCMEWRVSLPVISDFLGLFLEMLLEESQEILPVLEERVDFFLTEANFLHFKPSIIAISCIIDYFASAEFQEGLDACNQLIEDYKQYLSFDLIKQCLKLIGNAFDFESKRSKNFFTPENRRVDHRLLTTETAMDYLTEEKNIPDFTLE